MTIVVPRRATRTPVRPATSSSTGATPNRVARMRSNAEGDPPRCTWPSTVARVSTSRRRSISRARTAPMPPRRAWPNASTGASRMVCAAPSLGTAPSATTTMLNCRPVARRRRSAAQTSSRSKGTSGTRTASAPPASPPAAATHPASRPITSTTMMRWCDSVVECSLSIASMTALTAVSNPMVTSVPRTSLSIVLGMPTTATPSRLRRHAAPRVSSPPMATTASMPRRASVALMRAIPSASRSGLVRDVPRIVPPFGRIPETASRESGTRSSARSPRQPSRTPVTSSPFSPARLTTARMAALRPGTSPPPVSTAIRFTGRSPPSPAEQAGQPGGGQDVALERALDQAGGRRKGHRQLRDIERVEGEHVMVHRPGGRTRPTVPDPAEIVDALRAAALPPDPEARPHAGRKARPRGGEIVDHPVHKISTGRVGVDGEERVGPRRRRSPRPPAGRLPGKPDPARGPGGDEVARLQGQRLGDVRDQVRDGEDHGPGARLLHPLAAHVHGERERLGIRDLVPRDQGRTERPAPVEVLADHPLRRPPLLVPHGAVVEDGIAGHVVERARLGDVTSARANDRGQLSLEVDLGGDAGQDEGRARGEEAVREPAKKDRQFRRLRAALPRVLGVVAPDAEDLGRRRHGRQPVDLARRPEHPIALEPGRLAGIAERLLHARGDVPGRGHRVAASGEEGRHGRREQGPRLRPRPRRAAGHEVRPGGAVEVDDPLPGLDPESHLSACRKREEPHRSPPADVLALAGSGPSWGGAAAERDRGLGPRGCGRGGDWGPSRAPRGLA